MTQAQLRRLMASIATLTEPQRAALISALGGVPSPVADSALALPPVAALDLRSGPQASLASPQPAASIALIEARFAALPACPHCQGTSLGKWGSANGLKRYRCKTCLQTFNALTGTPLAQLHKRELWLDHGQALADGISLRKVAARLDVDLTTAFRWRHRFMQAPQAVKAKTVAGIVEADETYFLRSLKGQRKLARAPRKRGGKASKRGLSDEQVPVLVVRDRHAATTDQVLEDRSEASITAVLGFVVAKDSVLVSDAARAYRAFADKAEIPHIGLNASAGQRVWGIYHIQNVNAYISGLKGWLQRFKGVATKYLASYLGWRRMIERNDDNLAAHTCLIAALG
jgi:transposase-like protein